MTYNATEQQVKTENIHENIDIDRYELELIQKILSGNDVPAHIVEDIKKSTIGDKIRKLTSKDKITLGWKVEEGVLNFNKIIKILRQDMISIDSREEKIFDILSGADVRDFFDENLEENTIFTCKLIKGNFAWISRNEHGHSRYFSKKKNSQAIALDFTDLSEVYFKDTTANTLYNIFDVLKLDYLSNKWENGQKDKYETNFEIMHDIELLENEYPYFYKLVYPHIKVLETLNVVGSINIKNEKNSYNYDNIFFSSNSYISNFVGGLSRSKANRLINFFNLLGLIIKLDKEDVPAQLLQESKAIAKRRKTEDIVSYFAIPLYDLDFLNRVEVLSKYLYDENIKYYNLTLSKIAEIERVFSATKKFVKENGVWRETVREEKDRLNKNLIVDEVVLQSSVKGNTEIKQDYDKFLSKISKEIKKIIDKKGYVTKAELIKIRYNKMSVSERTSAIEENLSKILDQGKLQYTKPTKNEFEKYKLKNYSYIITKN